jgi:serine protease Do
MMTLVLSMSMCAGISDPLEELEQQQQRLFERVAPTVVFITHDGTLGSGVVVGKGLILTNAHVVGKAQVVDVVLHDGRKAKGKVVERAANDIDLALVSIPLVDVPVAELMFESALHVGGWVGAIGHGEGSVWSFNVGMVSNLYDGKSQREVFQTQIPLNPGNSGGPIFDRRGVVVGIVVAGVTGANSLNFGIDMGVAFRTLKGLRGASQSLTLYAPDGVPVFLDGRNVGNGPVVVVPRPSTPTEAFAIIKGVMTRAPVAPDTKEVRLGPSPPAR